MIRHLMIGMEEAETAYSFKNMCSVVKQIQQKYGRLISFMACCSSMTNFIIIHLEIRCLRLLLRR